MAISSYWFEHIYDLQIRGLGGPTTGYDREGMGTSTDATQFPPMCILPYEPPKDGTGFCREGLTGETTRRPMVATCG